MKTIKISVVAIDSVVVHGFKHRGHQNQLVIIASLFLASFCLIVPPVLFPGIFQTELRIGRPVGGSSHD